MCGRICVSTGGAGAAESATAEEPELEVAGESEPEDDPYVSELAAAEPSVIC